MKLLTLLSISRPRFWLYLGGTYLVGTAFGLETIYEALNPAFWSYFVFFTIPANVFLYGVNDYFDRDTDAYNPKKNTKEHRLKQKETKELKTWLTVTALMFVLLMFISTNWWIRFLLVLFVMLSTFYSMPPIRFKARPILDFLSNTFYIIPGLIGYIQSTNELPSLILVAGLACWTWAMHLFSAIPDITADKKADIETSAIFFGYQKSLLVCGIFWSIFSFVCITYTNWWPWSFFTLIYPLIAFTLYTKPDAKILKVYWYFPFINAVLGFGAYAIAFIRLL